MNAGSASVRVCASIVAAGERPSARLANGTLGSLFEALLDRGAVRDGPGIGTGAGVLPGGPTRTPRGVRGVLRAVVCADLGFEAVRKGVDLVTDFAFDALALAAAVFGFGFDAGFVLDFGLGADAGALLADDFEGVRDAGVRRGVFDELVGIPSAMRLRYTDSGFFLAPVFGRFQAADFGMCFTANSTIASAVRGPVNRAMVLLSPSTTRTSGNDVTSSARTTSGESASSISSTATPGRPCFAVAQTPSGANNSVQ